MVAGLSLAALRARVRPVHHPFMSCTLTRARNVNGGRNCCQWACGTPKRILKQLPIISSTGRRAFWGERPRRHSCQRWEMWIFCEQRRFYLNQYFSSQTTIVSVAWCKFSIGIGSRAWRSIGIAARETRMSTLLDDRKRRVRTWACQYTRLGFLGCTNWLSKYVALNWACRPEQAPRSIWQRWNLGYSSFPIKSSI